MSEFFNQGELQFALTTKALKIIEMDYKIWHRNFYEHIIRNEDSFLKILSYIRNNPAQWQEDEYSEIRDITAFLSSQNHHGESADACGHRICTPSRVFP